MDDIDRTIEGVLREIQQVQEAHNLTVKDLVGRILRTAKNPISTSEIVKILRKMKAPSSQAGVNRAMREYLDEGCVKFIGHQTIFQVDGRRGRRPIYRWINGEGGG